MDDIEERLQAFVGSRKLDIVRRIGFGIHGQVFAVRGATTPFLSAVKVFDADPGYGRERDVYLRLSENQILSVADCAVPEMIEFSDSQSAAHWAF